MSSADKYFKDLIQIKSLKTKPKPKPKSYRNLSNFEEFKNVYSHVFDGGKPEAKSKPAQTGDAKGLKVVQLEMPHLGTEQAIFVPPSRKKSQVKSILKKQSKQPPPQPHATTRQVVSQLQMLEKQAKKESKSALLQATPSTLLEKTKQDLGIAEEQLRTIKALIQSKEIEKSKQKRVSSPVYKTNKPNRHSECFNRKYLTSLNSLKLRLQDLEKKYFSKPQIVYKSVNDNFTQSSDIKILYENVKYPEDPKIDSALKNIISDLNGLINVSVDKKSSQSVKKTQKNQKSGSNYATKKPSSMEPIGNKRNMSESAVKKSSNSIPREFNFDEYVFSEQKTRGNSNALNEVESSAPSSLDLKDLLSSARSFMEKRRVNRERSNDNSMDYEVQRKATPRNVVLKGLQSKSNMSFGNRCKKGSVKSIPKIPIEKSSKIGDDAGNTIQGSVKSILKLPRDASFAKKSTTDRTSKLPYEVSSTGFKTLQEPAGCILKPARKTVSTGGGGELEVLTGSSFKLTRGTSSPAYEGVEEQLKGTAGSIFKLPREISRTAYEDVEEQLKTTASIFKLPRDTTSSGYDHLDEHSKETTGNILKLPHVDAGYDDFDDQLSEISESTFKLPREGSSICYDSINEVPEEKSFGNILKISHSLSDKFSFDNTEAKPNELYYQDSVFRLLDDTKLQLETLADLDQFNQRNEPSYQILMQERTLSASIDDASCYSKNTRHSDNESEQGDYFSGIIDRSESRVKKLMNIKQDVKEVHEFCEKLENITKDDEGEENSDHLLHGTELEKSVLSSSYLMREFQLHPSRKFYGSDAPMVSKKMVQDAVKTCAENSHLDMNKLKKSLDSALNNSIYSGAKF